MRTCRAIGHAWDPYTAEKRRYGEWGVILRCTRCTTLRLDIIDRFLAVVSRYYVWPDGYRDAELTEGTRADHRMWLAREWEKSGREIPEEMASMGAKRK